MGRRHTSALSDLPAGFVPRVETSEDQKSFLRGNPDVAWVMLDLPRVASLANAGETARTFFPEGQVITTSTVHDTQVARYHFDRELSVILRFKPAWHVARDRPVYAEDSAAGRAGQIADLVRSTIEFRKAVEGSGIGVIPLIKGIEPTEWGRCYRPLAEAGFLGYACYVKQFFGGGQGRRLSQMVNHVRGIVSSCGMPYLVLIGYQSLSRMPDMPPEVRAFAGQGWRGQTRLGKVSIADARARYSIWAEQAKQVGRTRQEVLHVAAGTGSSGGE